MNNKDMDLDSVLERADAGELDTLVEYLKLKLSEDLTNNEKYKEHAPDHTKYTDIIANEIRKFGGNTFVNLYRGEGVPYFELVEDVAKQLKAKFNENHDIETIENRILEKIITDVFEKMTEEEKKEFGEELDNVFKKMKEDGVFGEYASIQFPTGPISLVVIIAIFRAGGFLSYQLTVIIANIIARTVLGAGLSFATNATLTKLASIMFGPIGMALAGIWLLIDIAGPSYKTTIPCVIHIAMLRKKYFNVTCSKCKSFFTDTNIKFCPNCGNEIGS